MESGRPDAGSWAWPSGASWKGKLIWIQAPLCQSLTVALSKPYHHDSCLFPLLYNNSKFKESLKSFSALKSHFLSPGYNDISMTAIPALRSLHSETLSKIK
jgi:hypothetical protein